MSILANHSLTRATWSSYSTASRMLETCHLESSRSLTYPLDQEDILFFISWLVQRGLTSSTISSYLSAVRQIHMTLGFESPVLRSDLVNQILTGKKNVEHSCPSSKPKRLPVTPTILRIIKLEMAKDASLCMHDTILLWFLCSLSFHGSFRMGELLSRSSISFDPQFTLLQRDIRSKHTKFNDASIQFLEISLKSTKTTPTATTIIDVFPTNNDLCPMKAFLKWVQLSGRDPAMPAFRLSSGNLLTPTFLNRKLKLWLEDYLDFSKTSISGHSFRAGLVSVLGSLGFEDSDLKSIGRWSSRAFLLYTKLPRTRRHAMAKALGNIGF